MHTCTHTGGFPKGFLNLRVLLGYLIAQATYTWLWQQCIGSPSFSRSLTVKATGVSKMIHFVKAHHLRPGLCPTCLPPPREQEEGGSDFPHDCLKYPLLHLSSLAPTRHKKWVLHGHHEKQSISAPWCVRQKALVIASLWVKCHFLKYVGGWRMPAV
jgi:hypothetical protein